MKTFKELMNEVHVDRNANFKNALLKPITDLFDEMQDEENDRKWATLNRKAKKEFERARITGMDYHGFLDLYMTVKRSK